MTAYRLVKARHPVFDTTGARIHGGRWNSPGSPVIYFSDSFAGSILEILTRAVIRRSAGTYHHAVVHIPDSVVEVLDETTLPGWDGTDVQTAPSRTFGDRWLRERRTLALSVPSVPSRPHGRNVLLNRAHPDFTALDLPGAKPFVWDRRLIHR